MSVQRTVVLTMAGDSQRFRAEGVTTPKWALTAGGKPLLAWSLLSIAGLLDQARLLLVVHEHDQDHVEDTLAQFPPPAPYRLVTSQTGPRLGQAVDAARAVATLPKGEQRDPVVVWNIDTIVRGVKTFPAEGHWLQLARKRGSCWSFAELDGTSVVRTAEKDRISAWASTGLYGFASGRSLVDLVAGYHTPEAETYVAPLYNVLIARGEPVLAQCIPAAAVLPMGTPEQFRRTCQTQRWALPPSLRRSETPRSCAQ